MLIYTTNMLTGYYAHIMPYHVTSEHTQYMHTAASAAVERVFSTLNNSFSDDQKRALEDYIELTLSHSITKAKSLTFCTSLLC